MNAKRDPMDSRDRPPIHSDELLALLERDELDASEAARLETLLADEPDALAWIEGRTSETAWAEAEFSDWRAEGDGSLDFGTTGDGPADTPSASDWRRVDIALYHELGRLDAERAAPRPVDAEPIGQVTSLWKTALATAATVLIAFGVVSVIERVRPAPTGDDLELIGLPDDSTVRIDTPENDDEGYLIFVTTN